MAFYGREVPLSSRYLATLASPELDSEARLIAAEEQESEEREDDEERQNAVTRGIFEKLRDFLPREEQYLVEAHYLRGQSQVYIGKQLGHPKTSVQYRVNRAIERLQWALTLKTWNVPPAMMRRHLEGALPTAQITFAIVLWSSKWNQSRTAQKVGSTQSHVRIQVMRLHRVLKDQEADPIVAPYAEDLSKVIDGHHWCLGSAQHQGIRAIKFPRLSRRR